MTGQNTAASSTPGRLNSHTHTPPQCHTTAVSLVGKGGPYSTAEHRVPELIPVLSRQPAGDVSYKPGGRLPLLSARPAVTLAALKEGCYRFHCLVNKDTMGVNSLPKTVTRQHRSCGLNPGPSAPESSTLTTRLLSHPLVVGLLCYHQERQPNTFMSFTAISLQGHSYVEARGGNCLLIT